MICTSYLFCAVFVLSCSKYFQTKIVQVIRIQLSKLFHYRTNERINSVEHDVCREGSSSAATVCIPFIFRNPSFDYSVRVIPRTSPIMSQIKPAHSIASRVEGLF